MRLEKETSIYQLGAIAAGIGAATTLANGKNKIFYQDTAPATGMNEGDLWFKVDSSGGSSLYEYKKTGSNPNTYAWTLRQLGQGSLVAGSVTANEISVNDLSAISANLGSVIVGGLNNEDGVITIKDANSQTIGYWDNTGINASAGFIGNWQIVNGVLASYVGNLEVASLDTEFGIRYYDHYGMGWIHIDPGGRIHARSMSTYYPIYWCLDDENTHDESNVYPGYFAVENSNPNTNNYDGKWGQYNSELGMWLNGLDVIPVVVELGGWTKGASIAFKSLKDGALLTNYYNGTTYNLIRNHNNGNISISASGNILYLGYENTPNGINFLNGKATIDSNGCFEVIRPSGSAWMQAKNANNGNGIWMQAETAGTVTLGSRGANGTTYDIFRRANNANTITAYCVWTFNNAVIANMTAMNGDQNRPVITHGTSGAHVARVGSNATQISVLGQWGTTGDTYSWRYITAPSSDIRLKKNVENCKVSALPIVESIKMREFDWEDGRHQKIGVVADELEELDTRLAIGGGYSEDGNMSVKTVDTFYLMGYLIKAVQELSAEVKRLKGVA